MEKSNLDKLFEKYITGEISTPENVKLEAWLNMTKTTNSSDIELSTEQKEQLYERIIGKEHQVGDVPEIKPRLPLYIRLVRIAAAITIIALTGMAAWIVFS